MDDNQPGLQPRQIDREIERLHQTAKRLDDMVTQAEEQFSNILISKPESAKPTDAPTATLVPMAEVLNHIGYTMDKSLDRLRSILDRVQN